MGKVVIENADGTERELETIEPFKEVPDDVHEGSGLYQSLKEFFLKIKMRMFMLMNLQSKLI
jgi:hypothetical protein